MKKTFTKIMLLLFALIVGCSSAWADSYTFALNELYQNGVKVTDKTVLANNSNTNGQSLVFYNSDGKFKITITKNNSNTSPGFYTSSGYIRFYNSDVLTIESVNNDVIKGLSISTQSSGFNATVSPGSLNNQNWSGSASSISFTGTGTNKWNTITITYAHTLTYSATNGSISGKDSQNNNVVSGATFNKGETVTLTALPNDGYEFSSWSDGGNNSTLSSTSTNPTSFTMGTANVTVTATFVESGGATTYSVTYNENGATSGSVPTDGNSYEANDLVTVLGNTENLAKTGNAFSGWCMNAGGTGTVYGPNNTTTFNITSNTTLYAKWTPYTITAASNNNSYGTVALNGNVITATPASGYGYASPAYTVSSGTATVVQNENEFTVTPTSDCTITINFEAIPTHTATFSVNGTTTTQDFAEGATITFPADPADINGNKFVGWYGSTYSDPTTAPIFIDTEHETMGNSDKTYYAVFAAASESVETDELTTSTFGSPSSYTSWSDRQATNGSSAVYAGQTTGGTNYIQIRATSPSGIVTTTSGGKVAKVTVSWNSNTADDRTLDVYGKNSAYSDASDLYSNDATVQGTSLGSLYHNVKINNVTTTTTELTITGDYQFIGLRSKSSAMYLDEIDIQWTAVAYSDYNTTVVLPTVETPSFTVPEGTYNAEQSVKINCATTGATIYYTTNGNDPDETSTEYEPETNISITQTTTLKAIAIKGDDSSEIASATYTLKCATPQFDAPAGTYTADQTVAISTTTGSTIYYTTDNTDPTNESTEYTAALTIDATTTLKAIAYKSGWSPSDVATAQYNLPIVYANIAAFKEAYSSTSNELVKITGPLTTVYHNGKNLYVQDATGGMLVYDANAGTNNAIISRTYENGQTVSNIYGTYTKYNGLVEFIPSIDFPAPGEGTVVEPTDITTLSGSNYSTYESMLVRLTNATFSADATLTTSSATNVNMTASSNTVVLRNGFQRLAGSITNGDKANVVGFATIYSKNATTTYQIFPRDNNDIQYILDDMDIDDEVTINFAAIVSEDEMVTIEEGGILTVEGTLTNNGGPQGGILIDNGGQLNCPNAVEATIYKNISTAWNPSEKTGWYTIASPIGEMGFTSVGNLTPEDGEGNDTYDIYAYDEPRMTWWNSISSEVGFDPFTSFENGRGYLYRKGDTDALEFAGTINVAESYKQSLTVDASVEGLRGFALLGNPYSHNITLKHVVAEGNTLDECYVLTGEGAWTTKLTAENDDEIAPCQGFLVQATTAGDAYIHKTAQSSKGRANNDYIKFIVANNQYEDVTFALFDEGHGLNKINHRNSNIQQIYIPKDGESFAVATMADNTQSFNLNFKAMTMGQYTLSFKAKGEFNYLHVIDRMTGEDIDMLLEGEYSFMGSPQDSEARFIVRLGYLPNYDNNGEDIFAYQNGSDIIVSGEGELQIFDVMGRMVSTQNVNGTELINVNAQGVYVLRLVGTDIKTQKIVVR